MSATVPLGRFVWHELLTTDPAGAAAFYTGVLGWSAREWLPSSDAARCALWAQGSVPLGGLMQLPQDVRTAGAPPYWLAYVSTPDADATVARAWGLGAKILAAPMDMPGVGRVAVLADPQGAAFAIHTPENVVRAPVSYPPVGRVSWHELAANDAEGAFAFYQELFYWQKTDTLDMGPLGTYRYFGHGAVPLGGLYDRPVGIPAPNWLVYVRVADLERALARVKTHGGRVLNGPVNVPDGDRIAQCMDPQGAAFALHWRAED